MSQFGFLCLGGVDCDRKYSYRGYAVAAPSGLRGRVTVQPPLRGAASTVYVAAPLRALLRTSGGVVLVDPLEGVNGAHWLSLAAPRLPVGRLGVLPLSFAKARFARLGSWFSPSLSSLGGFLDGWSGGFGGEAGGSAAVLGASEYGCDGGGGVEADGPFDGDV
jgi:hypothetical protein